MLHRLTVRVLCVAAVLVGALWLPAASAPKALLWERWAAHDPASAAKIDHRAWGAFLQRYLVTGSDGINRFAYGDVTSEDRRRLDRYVDGLAKTAISGYRRPEQLAFWINLYNALTVQAVLDHYPLGSIQDIGLSPGLLGQGPWGRKRITIEGAAISLDDIEHQILRPIWKDPRIHYALNCAALGCPNLQPVPFDADDLNRQLDNAAIEFVNHGRALDIDGQRLTVSSIYAWFREDFGGDDRSVIAHLKAYAQPDLAMRLEKLKTIHGNDYDWRLNDIPSTPGS